MLYAAVRGVIFVLLLLIIGSQNAADLVRRTLHSHIELLAPMSRRLRRMLAPLLSALVVACLAKLALQVLSFREPGDPITAELVESVIVSGTWGSSWVMQVSTVILFLGWLAIGGKPKRWATIVGTTLTMLILWNQTGMGHAAGSNWGGLLGRGLDMLHLIGLGLWLGTLGALAYVAFPSLSGEAGLMPLARVVRAFSLTARIGVSLVIVSGVITALKYVGPLATILQSTWGRLLAIKLALMLGVIGLGWYNWRIVTPALQTGHPKCRERLRLAVRAEILTALAMLGLTAFLVASALPGEG